MNPLTRAVVIAAAVTGLVSSGLAGQQKGLTGARELAGIYDAILDADFDRARASIEGGCGQVPAPACDVLRAVATWWRIQLDPENRSFDEAFVDQAKDAIDSTSGWTEREPQRAEAWFYLGGAYGARVQWRVLRGERLAAARDGKRIKDALEQALDLDPDLHDAWFGIGLYHYYADIAPTALKMLRWLLALPGGDRVEGLREMQAARERGTLVRGEADYQLHLLYLWYEKQPREALTLLQELQARHPENPLFLARIAEVEDTYLHDHAASLERYRALADAARLHQVNEPAIADALARFGQAAQLAALFEPDRAIEVLEPLTSGTNEPITDAPARASLAIGVLEDSIGRRADARRAWNAALASVSARDPHRVRDRVSRELRRRRDRREAESAGLSIAGWRAFERSELAAAEDLLRRAAERRPDDPVVQYRLARVWTARRATDRAAAMFETVCEAERPTPPTFLAAACYEGGRIYESTGERAKAIAMYSAADRVALADRATREATTRALQRLRAPRSSSLHD